VPGIGAYQHVLFRRWLAEHGADYTKVNYVEVPLAQGSDILKAGNVDAMLLGEPYYRRVLASKSGYLVAPYLADMPDGLISMSYATKRDYALANGPVLKAFRAALEEATVFLAANPEESRKILAEGMRLPADVVDTMTLPRLEVKLQVGGLEYWEDTLLKQGMIRKAPDAASLIVTE
jgi:NitT/TauT family transport system substrate-binding protein